MTHFKVGDRVVVYRLSDIALVGPFANSDEVYLVELDSDPGEIARLEAN